MNGTSKAHLESDYHVISLIAAIRSCSWHMGHVDTLQGGRLVSCPQEVQKMKTNYFKMVPRSLCSDPSLVHLVNLKANEIFAC